MANQTENVLTPEFLMEMFMTCMENEYVLGTVAANLKSEHLPDRDFQALHKNLCEHYNSYKKTPTFSVLKHTLSGNRGASILLDDIFETSSAMDAEVLLDKLEEYIKNVSLQKLYKEMGKLFVKQEHKKAQAELRKYAEWESNFSLKASRLVDIIGTFDERFADNRKKHNTANKTLPVNRFYINELDIMNNERSLRGQCTIFLAATGVGKSHAARWIGKNACQIGGLDVLHIQLEGSSKEAENAYSASLVCCDSFRYETGTLRDADVAKMIEDLKEIAGRLCVKSYPKFNNEVSTINVKADVVEFRKQYGKNPDVVIIDSIDLLTDASGKHYSENATRHKRVAVVQDLKDIAGEEDLWMVGTYQATIENRDWINDEKNVLTEFNCAEAKGLARPATHLITLNQSDRERKECTMRLNVAKARFFARGEPLFKIATDYDNEQFYDAVRTMNINKAG